MTAPPGDRPRLFVVEQDGRSASSGRQALGTPFLDIRSLVRAAASRACCRSPSRPTTRRAAFYVYYTDRDGDTAVVEYRAASADARRPGVRAARADAWPTARAQPQRRPAAVRAGRAALHRHWATAAAAATSTARAATRQNLGTLLGKILRIDPRADGRGRTPIPADNPFVGRAGARGEICAYGLRNPWRFSFDRQTGDLVDRRRRPGRGRGDRLRAGAARAAGRTSAGACSRALPLHAGRAAPGASSPSSPDARRRQLLDHRRRRRPRPALPLAGRYVFADFCRASPAAVLSADGAPQDGTGCRSIQLSSFGEDARGRVYVAVPRRTGLPAARAARSPIDFDVVRIRADNPSLLTLTGTNTWIVGRDPAWIVDPGPALDATSTRSRQVAGARRRRRHRADPRPRRPRRGGAAAGRAARGRAARLRRARSTVPSVRSRCASGHADDHVAFVLGRAALHGRRGARRGQRLRRGRHGGLPRRAAPAARAGRSDGSARATARR